MPGMALTKGGLYIPPEAAEDAGIDLRQRYTCTVCGTTFREGEEYKFSAHVAACAKTYEAEIRESSPRYRAPGIFGDEGVDTEFRDYVRRTGKIS